MITSTKGSFVVVLNARMIDAGADDIHVWVLVAPAP